MIVLLVMENNILMLTAVCEYTREQDFVGYVLNVPEIPIITGQPIMELKKQLDWEVAKYCKEKKPDSHCHASYMLLFPLLKNRPEPIHCSS